MQTEEQRTSLERIVDRQAEIVMTPLMQIMPEGMMPALDNLIRGGLERAALDYAFELFAESSDVVLGEDIQHAPVDLGNMKQPGKGLKP